MGQIKCGMFINFKNHFQSLGPGREEDFIRSLPPGLQAIYRSISPVQKLPVETVTGLLEKMGAFLFPEDDGPARLARCGRIAAREDLGGIYRMLLKMVTVNFAMQQAAVLWQSYHDQGTARVERVGQDPNHLRLIIADYPELPASFRWFISGWIEAVADICGVRSPRVTPSQLNSDEIAWDVQWS